MSNLNDRVPPASPPFNAIRAFVETARQRSFSRAAQALGLTQGGVSRHVASLEKQLGQTLLLRRGGNVELTDAGRLYFDAVQEPMSAIELATLQMASRQLAVGRLLVRTSLPTFAMTALVPMLPRFTEASGITVDLLTSLSMPAPGDAYDVLITRDLMLDQAEHWMLGHETLVCVGSPSRPRAVASSLAGHGPFVVAQSRPDVLIDWCRHVGIDAHSVRVAGSFDHYFLAISAAISGMGLLVVPRWLVADPLRHGLLEQVVPDTLRSAARYQAYLHPRSAATTEARAFCRWLKGQLRDATEQAPGPLQGSASRSSALTRA